MSIKSYKDLLVWQKTRHFVKALYEETESFPSSELYGMTSQIRRAAVSISSNIAEGCARSTRKEYAHFISVAFGSASELEALLFLARDLNYLKTPGADVIIENLSEILRMLNKLRQSLKMAA